MVELRVYETSSSHVRVEIWSGEVRLDYVGSAFGDQVVRNLNPNKTFPVGLDVFLCGRLAAALHGEVKVVESQTAKGVV